ncbi:mechanosensitive ion channel family protein [Corticibacter populi]|uniref:mechanosensitive ion channel family protein n=1 Tax=Corticibacter populi TaxID=1550736 RepID=UPI001FD0668F|nr:mechanosensitive ion channel family protein [Corticibacter populi]
MIDQYLPTWMHAWLAPLTLCLQILLIIVTAWVLRRLIWRIVERLGSKYLFPPGMLVPLRTMAGWFIIVAALLMVMQRLGVSATVIWTAFTGFAAVAAVAFFAAWSVLSNLFCSFLIFTAAPFRVGDRLEILDAADKPGVKGRVLEIHLLYTSLEDLTSEETKGARLQIPNSAFFQKSIRRWHPDEADLKSFVWKD